MDARKYLLQLILLLSYINCCYCHAVEIKLFKAIYGHDVKSPMPILRLMNQCSKQRCYLACGGDDSCQGFNYLPTEFRCELLQSACQPGQQLTSTGNIYMERLDKREYCANFKRSTDGYSHTAPSFNILY